MTGHFLVESIMLTCQHFKGRHAAENICQVYDDVLDNYNIQNRMSFTVTDNASNMIKTFTLFPPVHDNSESEDEEDDTCDLEVVNVECSFHQREYLALLIDSNWRWCSLKSLLCKIQKLVAFCHKSTQMSWRECTNFNLLMFPAGIASWRCWGQSLKFQMMSLLSSTAQFNNQHMN